ncbi:CynX/NimT family MFS transporter [Kocuria sp. HSID16901]|uniref:CynX/NimT family MFS transporter n=1 Tax=Kocuria sp. HSID16901 TaxID=2419505 RepID=UPI0006616904|nr:MFS transporter [Kocuria sp. HSID16901]RUQ23313.1 MFS transporter [Kocuria sp. HSID16901]
MTSPTSPSSSRRVSVAWCVVVLLIASCLRPALTTIGPVLHEIGHDTGLGAGGLGLIGALPLLAFAVLSPVVSLPAQRIGIERVVLVALVILSIGILLRSTPGAVLLWLGTLLVGVGIAIGNVLVPVIVKRDFSRHVALMTGLYTAVLSTGAATASGFTAPLSHALPGGWRTALALWAIVPIVCAIWWAFLTRRARRAEFERSGSVLKAVTGAMPTIPSPVEPSASRQVSLWKTPIAWQVTVFMGLQSLMFYTAANWLPTIEATQGFTAAESGLHLFVMQIVGILGNLSVSFFAGSKPSQSWLAMILAGFLVVAVGGALVAPQAAILWASFIGIGCGGSFSLALTMIGYRTNSYAQTMKLSGMAQCLGYLMAALGPLLAGWFADLLGGWAPVLFVMLGLTVVHFIAGILAGRDRKIGAEA